MNNTPNHQHNLGRAFVIIALLLATTFISDRFRSGPSTAQVDGVYRKIPSSEKPYVHAETRTINFSGYEWIVRANQEKQGPGPNYFNGSTESVWIDSEGNLHLKIRKIGDEWHCSEVYTTESFGYGSYIFKVAPGWTNLDENTVVGLFTYYTDTQEIDIEFARWGQEEAPNAQYALQPAGQKGNLHQFSVDRLSQSTIHSFTWCSKYVDFYSSTLTDVDA